MRIRIDELNEGEIPRYNTKENKEVVVQLFTGTCVDINSVIKTILVAEKEGCEECILIRRKHDNTFGVICL